MHPGLKAVVFDWAGTMIDFGSRAPVVALCKLFAAAGVPITEAEARADMGMAKSDHIDALLASARVRRAWTLHHGQAPTPADSAALFADIGPMMQASARECTDLIPGAAEIAARMRSGGVKIGSCTGYTRQMMVDILPLAAAQGYAPDALVCAGDTLAGRPTPLMLWKNFVDLGVWPASACVKVDDAAVGIAEGRAAGAWTVGVAASGNGVGLSEQALAALAPQDRAQRIETARSVLLKAGAHVVIDSVADLPEALAQLPIG
ncbi:MULTISPECIES: phosphonoacetaldehyde hydrolase [unclassified Novosphingobium]|uniref:phosphonoacetaldehyde hydrolase n=1 Tax=unclassified Novosphingobium TaxID=2644732 RepID=UPI0013572198|nr:MULTISPECIES: phosphonoacetaldehyde hydrolase [unclassified Novosphingobium]